MSFSSLADLKAQASDSQNQTANEPSFEGEFEGEALKEKEGDSEVEKIQITGSRIKRVDIEGPNPVIIHTKEELERSGYLSVSGFLKNTSLSNFGRVQVHNRSTLTLVNGKRMVYDSAVDLIPLSAIDRIEILKDGSAALYGSDVVGGVINIITKTDIDANEITFKLIPTFPFNKGGNQTESSYTFSKKLSKGNFITSFQAQYGQALQYKDRPDYYEKYFIPYSYYPNFIQENQAGVIIDEKCPKSQLKNGFCQESLVPQAFIYPRYLFLSNYSYLEHDLQGDFTFYSYAIGLFQDSLEEDQAIIDDLKLPANHKMSQARGSAGILQYIFKEKKWDHISRFYFFETTVGGKRLSF